MSDGHRGPGRPPKMQTPMSIFPPADPAERSPSAPNLLPPRIDGSSAFPGQATCASCRFYRTKGRAGECRRFPPVPGFGDFLFPITLETSWCGEHRAQ